MPEYRLYCIDARGKFTKSHDFRAADDERALAAARELKLAVNCELWEQGRMVGKVAAHHR